MKYSLLLLLIITLSGCYLFPPKEHQDFQSACECIVYKNEVEVDYIDDYRVEYIDPEEFSPGSCHQIKCSGVELLYDDTSFVVVGGNAEEELQLIEMTKKKYNNDSSRVYSFRHFPDGGISLTLSRYFRGAAGSTSNGNYCEWKFIYLGQKNNGWQEDSSCITKMWPWNGKE